MLSVFFDPDRHAAYVALLAMPDPPDLHRGHVLTQPGCSDRRTRLLGLLQIWVQQQWLDRTVEEIPGKARKAAPVRRRRRHAQPIPFEPKRSVQ